MLLTDFGITEGQRDTAEEHEMQTEATEHTTNTAPATSTMQDVIEIRTIFRTKTLIW